MNRRRVLAVVACVLLIAILVLTVFLAFSSWWLSVKQYEERKIPILYYRHTVQGEQSFVVGPDLCNLTWTLKMNNTAYAYDSSYWKFYTSLYYVSVSLSLREIGYDRSNASQLIFIEPKAEPFGTMTRNGSSFQFAWSGNLTSYRAANFLGGPVIVWEIPTITFTMPYYVYNTTVSGIYSSIIAKTFITEIE
jgi:hypothetical protein